MQTIERTYPIKTVNASIASGNIVFDHPMQRKPGQWDNDQKSLLIHSIIGGFAIPQAYALPIIEGDFDSFSMLDGKQRFTIIYDFANDGFKLSKHTPSINVQKRKIEIDQDGKRHIESVTEEYEIAGKRFSELDEVLQGKFEDRVVNVIMLTGCTDEEIEDQFYRLNNGTSLTRNQKTRVTLGDDLAMFIDTIEDSQFFTKKSYFTANQRKNGDIQACILQTLMLVMDFPFKNFNHDAIKGFAEWFRINHKKSDLEYCEELFSKLNEAIPEGEKPNKLMKKTNIPIFAYHIQTIDEIGISLDRYGKWIRDFFDSYTPQCEYASYCGEGSTSKSKVMARLDYVGEQLRALEG